LRLSLSLSLSSGRQGTNLKLSPFEEGRFQKAAGGIRAKAFQPARLNGQRSNSDRVAGLGRSLADAESGERLQESGLCEAGGEGFGRCLATAGDEHTATLGDEFRKCSCGGWWKSVDIAEDHGRSSLKIIRPQLGRVDDPSGDPRIAGVGRSKRELGKERVSFGWDGRWSAVHEQYGE
jgi:hypothetical protein